MIKIDQLLKKYEVVKYPNKIAMDVFTKKTKKFVGIITSDDVIEISSPRGKDYQFEILKAPK